MRVALSVLLALACACSREPGVPKEPFMTPSRTTTGDFDRIELGTFTANECSPAFPDRKTAGVRISLPARVVLPSQGGRLPLCLAAQITWAEAARVRHVFEGASAVLVDDERGETFTASLWKDRTFRPQPAPPMSPEEAAVVTGRHYYSVNLLERLDLPRRPARYLVHVTLGQHRSEIHELEVAVE